MLTRLRRRLRHWWNRQPDPQICPRCHLYFDGDGRIVPECPDCALARKHLEEGFAK